MNKISRDRRYQILLFLCACLLHIPAWFVSFSGHSVVDNTLWGKHFAQVLLSGDFYPRWLPGMSAGCGSPVFFYYFPFPFYFLSLFGWLHGEQASFIAAYMLICALAALALYAWIKAWCPPRAAFLATTFYLLMPYLWIDIYDRDAYTEFFAFLFLPLLLNLTTKISCGNKSALFLFSLVYALQILSSLHCALIGSMLILSYALYLFRRGKSFGMLLQMAAAATLGIMMSCIYLLPIAEGFRYTLFGTSNNAFSGEYDYVNRLVFSSHRIDNNIFFIMAFALWLALCAIKPFRAVRNILRKDGFLFFWICTSLACLFMQTGLSSFIPALFPLLKVIQFPWRFHVVTCIAIPTAVARILADNDETVPVVRIQNGLYWTYILLFIAAMGTMLTAPAYPVDYALRMTTNIEAYPNEYLPVTASGIWLWSDRASNATKLCDINKVVATSAKTDSVHIEAWKSRDLRFSVNILEKGDVTVGQFNFPGWKAYDENGSVIPIHNSSQGLIALTLERGEHHVTLQLARWKSEVYGGWISLLGLTITLLGFLWTFCTCGKWIAHSSPSIP
jgi:hypothetical protein